MTFDGKLEKHRWYVCVPSVSGNEYHAMTVPLSRAEAFQVCKELNTLEPADYSDLTRQATKKTAHNDVHPF